MAREEREKDEQTASKRLGKEERYMMRHVKMKNAGECGPACFAMVSGVSLETALSKIPVGCTDLDLVDALRKSGLCAYRTMEWPAADCTGVVAILTVPSLNFPGILHSVVWDGNQILDPSPGPRTYPFEVRNPANQTSLPIQWASLVVVFPKTKDPK